MNVIAAAPLVEKIYQKTVDDLLVSSSMAPAQVIVHPSNTTASCDVGCVAEPLDPTDDIASVSTPELADCLPLYPTDLDSSTVKDGHDVSYSLHMLAHKKMMGTPLSDEEVEYVKSIDADTTGNDLLRLGGAMLIKEQKDVVEESLMRLSLSKILNLLDTDHMAMYQKHLDPQHWSNIRRSAPQLPGGLCAETSDLFDSLIAQGTSVKSVLTFIDFHRQQLSANDRQSSQAYTALLMVEQIVRNLGRWCNTNATSELTFYRRFASILELLFDDTDIILNDGEHCSAATKAMTDLNKALFSPGDTSVTYGRKIDLILMLNAEQQVEMSTNEWKRRNVREDLIVKQQAKNLMSNAATLDHLALHFSSNLNKSLAMDFVGNHGYLYQLEKLDGFFVASLVATLVIPVDLPNLVQFKETLLTLFKLKEFMVDQGRELKSIIANQEVQRTFPNLPLSASPTNIDDVNYIFLNH
ncbi:hypothetical protein DM01DRAFT_1338777 [Hesseltinella vesiculosa]|uniref:Uncharacterized protein n=1 Tax=Hesseltinella vesiculosa TaxID=101127 RepID=A0A1X2G9E1_9FUNG|nr:hypothetical protein DM01DRAFT_1338777 [Hesseltinella vesiculosa]